MGQLVLLRHGESMWNRENMFTGWVDVPLSEQGIQEALKAGEELADIDFSVIYVSTLDRAMATAMICLSKTHTGKTPVIIHDEEADRREKWAKIYSDKMNSKIIPVHRDWHLNERYYGELQGKNKKEMVDEVKVGKLREKYNLAGKKILLTVARLVESKGIDLVIKALPKVWQEIPELVYLVVGEGNFNNQLLVISDQVNPEKNKIIFTGAVPHNDLPNFYALADAFILTPHSKVGTPARPSGGGFKPVQDTESFGIVYLEAMEFGLPIIAGDVGGVREIFLSPPFQGGVLRQAKHCRSGVVNNNFILINSENIDEIVEKIIKVIK